MSQVILVNKKGEVVETTDVFYARQKSWFDSEGYSVGERPKEMAEQGIKPVQSNISVVHAQSVRAQQMDLDASRQVDENAGKPLPGAPEAIEPSEMLNNYPIPEQINPSTPMVEEAPKTKKK